MVFGQNATISGWISNPSTPSSLCRMRFWIQVTVLGFSYLRATRRSQIFYRVGEEREGVRRTETAGRGVGEGRQGVRRTGTGGRGEGEDREAVRRTETGGRGVGEEREVVRRTETGRRG
jgi:hypothetical protein